MKPRASKPRLASRSFVCNASELSACSDLRAQGSDFLLDALTLRFHQRHFAGERIAPRIEQRRLFHQRVFDTLICLGRAEQFFGKDEHFGKCLLRLKPRERGAFDMDAISQAIAIGIHADIPEHQDRITGLHVLTVAHEHGAHNAALEVLHRPPVEIDFDNGGRYQRHRERRKADPDAERHDGAEDNTPAGAHQASGVLLACACLMVGTASACCAAHHLALLTPTLLVGSCHLLGNLALALDVASPS